MADDSQPVKYVYVDSTNRDATLYPSGNSYTLHLTAPLHSVVQVDLVAAKVPNTIYNLTNGSNVLVFSTASTTSNISVAPGFYSACGLARAIMNSSGGTAFCIEYLADEGRYLFSSSIQFTLKGETSEIRKILGLETGTLSSFAAASNPIYTSYIPKWLYKSPKIADFSTIEYAFLDIDELRTTSVIDAKKLIGSTTEGATMRSTFGQVPLDVPSGSIKSFKETSDYKQYIQFTTPIPKLQRLTVRWVDHQGQLLNFQGFNNNAFTLRFHCEYQKVPEPTPPLQDLEIRRIVEAMTMAVPPPETKEPKRKIPWWLIVLVLVAAIVAYKSWPRPPVPGVGPGGPVGVGGPGAGPVARPPAPFI
jgi:hypothetical protein